MVVTTARWPWLLAAAGVTCLTWPAAACTRQGAVLERLPGRRLLAAQFAAGAANHLLPTGLGASAVNLRFMTVCGLSPARSSAALALYLLAECVGRVGLLGALLVAFPDALPFGSLLPDEAPVGPFLVVERGACAGPGRARRRTAGADGGGRVPADRAGRGAVGARPARAGPRVVGRGTGLPGAPGGRPGAGGTGVRAGGAVRAPGRGVPGGDGGGGAGAHAGRDRLGGGGAGRGAGGG